MMITVVTLYCMAVAGWFLIWAACGINSEDNWPASTGNAKLCSRMALLAPVWPIGILVMIVLATIELGKMMREVIQLAFSKN